MMLCVKMVATQQIKSLVPKFLVNWCLFIHKNTNTVDYYTNFLSIMKPSLPVKKTCAKNWWIKQKNYPLYEKLLSLATKRKYIQTVLQPYYTTRNHLCNNVNKFSYKYLFTLKIWCNKKKEMLQQKQKKLCYYYNYPPVNKIFSKCEFLQKQKTRTVWQSKT